MFFRRTKSNQIKNKKTKNIPSKSKKKPSTNPSKLKKFCKSLLVFFKKLIIFGFITGICAIICAVSINLRVIQVSNENIISVEKASSIKADCILVLGAGVLGNSRPSNMLEDRLLKSIVLYKAGISNRLLMSGDHGRDNYNEVKVMKNFAIAAGVPSENIFMDHAGFSTYESMYRAKSIFKAKKVIIVTQRYHLYRAVYIARKLGMEAYGVASDQRVYAGQSYRDVREVLARIKDFLNCIITPEPKYLGEEIPITGDGDVTNIEKNKQ